MTKKNERPYSLNIKRDAIDKEETNKPIESEESEINANTDKELEAKTEAISAEKESEKKIEACLQGYIDRGFTNVRQIVREELDKELSGFISREANIEKRHNERINELRKLFGERENDIMDNKIFNRINCVCFWCLTGMLIACSTTFLLSCIF